MSGSTYKLKLCIPKRVRMRGAHMDRERFSSWLWENLQGHGLLGVHEGTLLSEEAARKGLETESWTVDSAEAPRERDWIDGQEVVESEFYFETEKGARDAMKFLGAETDLKLAEHSIQEQPQEDWDAQWKASFLNNGRGVTIPPFWRVIPPWVDRAPDGEPGERALKINPGAGFGTGTHETTQLCLQAIAEILVPGRPARALDFGSGSGILAVGAALLGAKVDAVEIDPLAIDNAQENAKLNSVEGSIDFFRTLKPEKEYSLVIANILRPVLLEFAGELVGCLAPAPSGGLVLSGLIEEDVASVREKYSALLGGKLPEVRAMNEWRALVWKTN